MAKKNEAEGQGKSDIPDEGVNVADLERDPKTHELKHPNAPAAATDPKVSMDASGAIMEPAVKEAIDLDHVSVDNNPRAATGERQNRIDFNDPVARDEEVVRLATLVDPSTADVQPTEFETRRTERLLGEGR